MVIGELQATNGRCRPQSVVAGDTYRFTILTPQLIRMEYAADGIFEDRPTQTALNRDFETPRFTVYETGTRLEIDTDWLSVAYDKGAFCAGGLSVKVRSESRGIYTTWCFSEPVAEGLGGTARSLDQADGAVPLEAGIQSRIGGFGVIDDSKSPVLLEDGWLEPRRPGIQDIYFFGYGLAYRQCLKDYFHLCGRTPLLPRYAFGNWWSRFYPYTAAEYAALMDRFAQEGVPLSVAVLDMDWHEREIDPKYGKGWTGYTWNTRLFPDPPAFLRELHGRGLRVTLNLHPAEGVQPSEAMYEQMSRALGRDPALKQPVHFDFCDRAFVDAYFSYLHHPQEEIGVDFWWIDWQQGGVSKIPGADPLWLLNHFHFLDSANNGKRPLILSRYAGPGSHRYPVGFSGDTVISWASLRFQPYFTANAANIGFGWWSHDIGGHAGGARDDELMVRWLQFGAFSPILRLHSTSNLFNGKEPWKFAEPAKGIMKEYLRLRHRLIPYLYTMNWRCHSEDEPLVQPMYYRYPGCDEAYAVPNQYAFGSELIVCPVTDPMDASLRLGRVTAWLPEGNYVDWFTGLRYHGNRTLGLHRPLHEIPVLAKEGAIIPLAGAEEASGNGAAIPVNMEIAVFGGADGAFELYEDDGESSAYLRGQYALTGMRLLWNDGGGTTFSILPPSGETGFLPPQRQYTLAFIGVCDADATNIAADVDGASVSCLKEYDAARNTLRLTLPLCGSKSRITVRVASGLAPAGNRPWERIFALLEPMQIGYELKESVYRSVCGKDPGKAICELQTMELPNYLLDAISEILFA